MQASHTFSEKFNTHCRPLDLAHSLKRSASPSSSHVEKTVYSGLMQTLFFALLLLSFQHSEQRIYLILLSSCVRRSIGLLRRSRCGWRKRRRHREARRWCWSSRRSSLRNRRFDIRLLRRLILLLMLLLLLLLAKKG